MSQSDRLFLDDVCPTLHDRLKQKLVDDPSVQLLEQDFQDFEVNYSVACQDSVIKVKVLYPFLSEVLQHGLQELLDRVWQGLPVQGLKADPQHGLLQFEVDAAALGEDQETRKRCAQLLASVRIWLLVAPLVGCLQWLRNATDRARQAGMRAAPGGAAEAAAAAIGKPPAPICLQVRCLESCWIICKPDRVLVILSISLEDEVDVALGRAFCQEFAETGRKPMDFSLPCTFNEPRDLPMDLRGESLASSPNVGFLTLTLSDQCVRGASEDRLISLAKPVMTFRNFFHFHLKHAKSYLHSRLRKRLDQWQQQVIKARRKPQRGQELRRLATGRVFVPPPRAAAIETQPDAQQT